MNIYVLRSVAALLNFVLISFVVRAMPETLAGEYLLVLGYIVWGALIVGFGVDTGLERYASRFMSMCSMLRMLCIIFGISVLRSVLLLVFVATLNQMRPELIEVSMAAYCFAFFSFFFMTLTSLLNGILQFTASAVSNLVKATLRFTMFAIPLELISLNSLLTVEIVSSSCAAMYCIFIFARSKPARTSEMPAFQATISFFGWNYLSRLFLNIVSLNTIKVIILRSNHPNALIYAYAIQLTEAVERFLPSLVLAGKYRPELSNAFDTKAFEQLKRRIRVLGRLSAVSALGAAVLHLAVIPIAFVVFQSWSTEGHWPLFVICSTWLFIVNIKYCLNILSNVIEANYIQFAASMMLSIVFFATFGLNSTSQPLQALLTLTIVMALYPFVWFVFAYHRLRRLDWGW